LRPARPARRALLAAAIAFATLPAVAGADPASCTPEPNEDFALCVVTGSGNAAAKALEPTGGARNAVRGATDAVLTQQGICDPTDTAACLLPFPNDFFTVADPSTDTGRRVNFNILAMPRNVAGKPIDPTEWNRNDGFSPGTPVITVVPGLDVARTGIAGVDDIGASLAPDAPIVLINAATGARHPYFAELDANPTGGEQPALIIRPAVNFDEAARYVVALRGMKNAAGAAIAPNATFASRRDAAAKQWHPVKGSGVDKSARAAVAADPVFGPLVTNGYAIGDLYLAWTFTIASERNLTERLLHIRDDAVGTLGQSGPPFTVSSVTNNPAPDPIARVVKGKITVPSYLTNGGTPGSRFSYGADGLPTAQPGVTGPFKTQDATFTCIIPRSSGIAGTDPDGVHPSRASLYGHGLLGSQSEITAGNVKKMAAENNITFCATDWIGMATEDVPNVATILADMSNFPTLADRVQQGVLNMKLLGEAMIRDRGFAIDAAFQGPGGRPVLGGRPLYYDGNSQGGIIGGALVAVDGNIRSAVLGVTGMNYSTLLDRSVDFATYESVFNVSYPSELDREITFGLIQMLWDRAETNGYAHHLRNDSLLPNTSPKHVLLHIAFGDHQVANAAAEVEARTIGAYTNAGFLAPGRSTAVEPGWGIPRIGAYPYTGNALIYWDSGSDAPPSANVPPTAATNHGDPHSDPRNTRAARDQKAAWFMPEPQLIDVCNGGPCYATPLAPTD
jgi:hypothetical protein